MNHISDNKKNISNNIPQHVAVIMDGNGRWAEERHLQRTEGHIEGLKRAEEIVDTAKEMGINVLTLYTFSTENWNRPPTEINMLMNMLMTVLNKKLEKLKKDNIRFQVLGRRENVPENLLKTILRVEEQTRNNTALIVNLAFNYGARLEITDAVKRILCHVLEGNLKAEDISEQTISDYLYTKNLPDPDLLIRTSGEKRISNFLLWQLSYTEFYFTNIYWPDFDREEFKKAILDFQQRERRYGNLTLNAQSLR